MQVTLSWYTVENLEAAKKFYGETLGLTKTFEMPGWAEYSRSAEERGIGLAQKAAHNENFSGSTVVLRVADLDAKRRELIESGVTFEGETEEVPGIVRLATFIDPFGNRLQLMQELTGA